MLASAENRDHRIVDIGIHCDTLEVPLIHQHPMIARPAALAIYLLIQNLVIARYTTLESAMLRQRREV